jgi:hypothetical protein
MGSPTSDNQNPLPAYQYFENIRNFLVAVEELKLPTFEASDLERVSGSIKVVKPKIYIIISSKLQIHNS